MILSKALNKIILNTNKVVEEDNNVNDHILYEINSLLVQFLNIISEYHKDLPKESPEKKISLNLQIHLLSTIRNIKKSYEQNDVIMLNDLLSNELRDNLLQWKVNILPLINKIQN